MATDKGISAVLALLHELFPTREVTPATLDAWALVFCDWPDELLRECALKAARESGRAFFPSPGEIRTHAPRPPAPDVDAILARISALGSYNPHTGWQYPRPDAVREALGDAVAEAYGAAGGASLFAQESNDGSTITRDIARREFAAVLDSRPAPVGGYLGSGANGRALAAGPA